MLISLASSVPVIMDGMAGLSGDESIETKGGCEDEGDDDDVVVVSLVD
jgi:hypothetical protein